MNDWTIRSATTSDVPDILDIYNYYVHTSTCTFQLEPDTLDARMAWFTQRSEAHPVVVAEQDGRVIAWGALSPWNSRAGYVHSVEVSVYVRHELRTRGVGKGIMRELIRRAQSLGHHVLVGGSCTEHPASIALQESVGFTRAASYQQIGRKFGRWLDVVYLQMVLPEPAEPATSPQP